MHLPISGVRRLVLPALIALSLLIPLCPATAETLAFEDLPALTADTYPQMDGSTATVPLARALRAVLLGENPAYINIQHSTTPNAYSMLEDDEVDLILVTPPARRDLPYFDMEALPEWEFKKYDDGTPYNREALGAMEMIPVARDALVLLNNVANPVTNLSLSQLRSIYSGKTTSWKQVGGQDVPIKAYQRPERSGSQTLFLQLLMGDLEPMTPPQDWVPYTMGQLVTIVGGFENASSALGYSMYYYVESMYGMDTLRMLSVDGVQPTRESIQEETYPLGDYYYAVLPKDTPKEHPARQLVDWLVSPEGQRLVESAGYVPLEPWEEEE